MPSESLSSQSKELGPICGFAGVGDSVNMVGQSLSSRRTLARSGQYQSMLAPRFDMRQREGLCVGSIPSGRGNRAFQIHVVGGMFSVAVY